MMTTGTETRLPNFLVIGAPKSGTTSLYAYLKQHPDIYLPVRKELHYFTYELLNENVNGPGDRAVISSLCSSFDDYAMHYREVKDEKMIGEVSPSYLLFPEVAKRIKSILGEVKIVIMLRNPVEKAYSQYMHMVRDNLENLMFYDALMAEEERKKEGWSNIWQYAGSSVFAEKVRAYISVFGKENVRIVLFDDLVKDARGAMTGLFSFMNVDDTFVCDTSKTYNRSGNARIKVISDFLSRPGWIKSALKLVIPEKVRIPMRLFIMDLNTGAKEPVDERSRRYLNEYFKSDVRDLETIIERKLGWLEDME